MSGADCQNCKFDDLTGFVYSLCKEHDKPSQRVKLAGALAALGLWLDEASKAPDPEHLSRALGQAADAAVAASKAVIAG